MVEIVDVIEPGLTGNTKLRVSMSMPAVSPLLQRLHRISPYHPINSGVATFKFKLLSGLVTSAGYGSQLAMC